MNLNRNAQTIYCLGEIACVHFFSVIRPSCLLVQHAYQSRSWIKILCSKTSQSTIRYRHSVPPDKGLYAESHKNTRISLSSPSSYHMCNKKSRLQIQHSFLNNCKNSSGEFYTLPINKNEGMLYLSSLRICHLRLRRFLGKSHDYTKVCFPCLYYTPLTPIKQCQLNFGEQKDLHRSGGLCNCDLMCILLD